MWWWGPSPMLQELGNIQSEALRMRKDVALEKKLGIGYFQDNNIEQADKYLPAHFSPQEGK